MPISDPRLVVITGPVGGGKSSTGLALGEVLRRSNQSVAVIDLDQMYGFVRQEPGYGEQMGWSRARAGKNQSVAIDSDLSVAATGDRRRSRTASGESR